MTAHAFMVTAGPESVGTVANAIRYAISIDESGHESAVYLDGAATRWPGELQHRTDHPVAEYLAEARRRGLLEGACAFCADAFDATAGCESAGVDLLGSPDEHGPDVGDLVEEGFDLHTVG